MMYRLFLLIALSATLFSCKKDDTSTTSQPTPIAASSQLNVAYGTAQLQKMDIYLPANRSLTTTKVLVVIHGGAWSQGDKADMNIYIDTLKKRLPTYAIININYRLAVNALTTFPTQELDVKAALDYIIANSNNYLISNKIVLLGVSAGAHLALLHSYKNSNATVKAVIDFFGPTDMAAMYNSPAPLAPPSSIAQLFNGATPTSNPAAYMQSSPINYVTIQSSPTLILHGGNDPLVKPSQATALRDKLLITGVSNQYVFYPTEGHGWEGANLTDSYNKIESFLTQYVQ